ncbi:hypothetical protein Tco_0748662 [Tanacetum coccineum]|uniref:Reverse transcriptase domain-containing protein n=1 Tax=Tanacetum coccineum TaxID=301880 RepID=A0ABQ4YXE4_9ASTR
MTAFETRVRQDTDEVYTRLDDEQSQRQLLAGRLNMLFRDRRAHARMLTHGMRFRMSREAGVRSMDASDLARREVMSLRTTVLAQMLEIRELHDVDRRRQAMISEMLKADQRRSTKMREGQVSALKGQVTVLQGQQGPAGGPAQPELPEEAGSDVIGYNQRFQELALLCVRMFPEESDKIERLGDKRKFEKLPENIFKQQKTTEQEAEHWQGLYYRDWEYGDNANNANKSMEHLGQPETYLLRVCGVQGHYQEGMPSYKYNKNRGNQVGNDRAPAKVYVVGRAGTNPDSNIVTGTFLLNNRYASILFDMGLHIKSPEPPIQHKFNAHRISGSFECYNGMDWLAKYTSPIIVCAERTLYSLGNEKLIVPVTKATRDTRGSSPLSRYSKTQEYMLKGCPVFLAHVTTNEIEDKSEKKRLKDVPIVQDFPEVFPKDLLGLPPTRQVEFQIDLVPGAAPVARAPYRY